MEHHKQHHKQQFYVIMVKKNKGLRQLFTNYGYDNVCK